MFYLTLLRLFRSLLIALCVTLLLTAIEVGLLWVFNPFYVLGMHPTQPLAALLALPIHVPPVWLVPVGELSISAIWAFFWLRSAALLAYVREVQRADELYCQRYTSLNNLSQAYPLSTSYYQNTPQGTIDTVEDMLTALHTAEEQHTSLLLVGESGSGKTLAVHAYQHRLVMQGRTLLRNQKFLPLYVPLKDYSLFLKERLPLVDTSEEQAASVSLLDFLPASGLPGMRHLRLYLKKLMQQGRLVLLCDGFNEIDNRYQAIVAKELADLVLISQNRVILTCREVEYQQHEELLSLVSQGHLALAQLYPLQLGQIRDFVEQYMSVHETSSPHTAGQVMQAIDQSRLRSICTNPLLLVAFLQTVDNAGLEDSKQLDTRGSLLRERVTLFIQQALSELGSRVADISEGDVIRFLARLACAARWAYDISAIQLPLPAGTSLASDSKSLEENAVLAKAVQAWLQEHSATGLLNGDALTQEYDVELLQMLLQVALQATLISISASGVLSFRHEMLASYFIAEYFLTYDGDTSSAAISVSSALLQDVPYWSEPVALWAGLIDDAAAWADRFVSKEQDDNNRLQSLALSLICLGVVWQPPQMAPQPPANVPEHVATVLTSVFRDQVAREQLASLYTTCAQQGAPEMYHAIFSTIELEGIEEFLALLDTTLISALLFAQLTDIADRVPYEGQVRRISRILGSFGSVVVPQAAALSLPEPQRSLRLRAAAINILGSTHSLIAVDPLVACLEDDDHFIVDRAIRGLIRLGPELSLAAIYRLLEDHTEKPTSPQLHRAALKVLEHFLNEKQLDVTQYQHLLEILISLLSTAYAAENTAQQLAREILLRQVQVTGETSPVITSLIHCLVSRDDVLAGNAIQTLETVGTLAIPQLLEVLKSQAPEVVRVRVVKILRKIHDPRALQPLLRLVVDPSPQVQQQVFRALNDYAPESIVGLVELVLTADNEKIAEQATTILTALGPKAALPVAEALAHIVPGRTRLLVLVLERIHDPQSIPALVDLLQRSADDPLLAIAVIRALSQFQDSSVVVPLIQVLASPQPQIYEEAITALSSLGESALDELITALDVPGETPMTQRIQRAILGMQPFPGERLLAALATCTPVQALHILQICVMQGAEAASLLVHNLFHEDRQTREYVRNALAEMPGSVVVPALLEMLNLPDWQPILADYLLQHREAIPPLVNLLGDPERGEAAATILPRYGSDVLPALISGLSDPRIMAQEQSQTIIVALVRENPRILPHVVRLFAQSLPLRAHEALLEVLTNELADVSIPTLLEGLEDAHLVEDCSNALGRLARKRPWQRLVIDGLLEGLRCEERRRGAEIALIKVGDIAVPDVGELIVDEDPLVASAAQNILREIGVPALPFIWTAQGDTRNRARREAAMNIFHGMPTEVIKDTLVDLLTSDTPGNISMAVALLLERIHDEAALPPSNQEMIPSLLEYIQIHENEQVCLRVIALLLLLGGRTVVEQIVQILYEQPEYPDSFIIVLRLLGIYALEALNDILNDPHAPIHLRADAMGILSMLGADQYEVQEYATSLNRYGIAPGRSGLLNSEQLTLALRALGGLLVTGRWDVQTLQELRLHSEEGSPQHELYSMMLGWTHQTEIAQLQEELRSEREARKREIMTLTTRIVADQDRIHALEYELEQVQQEHGMRGDELMQVQQERETYKTRLDRALREKQSLLDQINQLQVYNSQLIEEIHELRGTES